MEKSVVSVEKGISLTIVGGIACSFSSYLFDVANEHIRTIGSYAIEMGVLTIFFVVVFFFIKQQRTKR
ncbi:MAG: hypothetical protein LBI72_03230 [Flavobacteriaceae bacterium]|jgi:hypothetical protein|nr:hypothetical protein [Flavobacteriaceae bacterium]